jgi:hypothetical protein
MEQSYLERLEKLEQLRVLENGYKIQMIETEYNSIGIDTQEDYEKAINDNDNSLHVSGTACRLCYYGDKNWSTDKRYEH